MKIDVEGIRQHYASLTDDELIEIDRSELTDTARQVFDGEVARRGLDGETHPAETTFEDDGAEHDEAPFHAETNPDWIEDAAIACSYVSRPGGTAASDADRARDVLLAAGVPCRVSMIRPEDPETGFPEIQVLVPGPLNLKATAILDRDLFNDDLEADWRTHFEALSDADLRALTPDAICAGLQDRIARLKRAYADEVARRKTGRA